MGAPLNNRYWMARCRHGRKLKFASAEALWDVCCEYFRWVEDNPLQKEQVSIYRGEVIRTTIRHMRPMTLIGLQLFIGLSHDAWGQYRKRQGFYEICDRVEAIIFVQKFDGALAGIFKPAIIARDLWMHNKQKREASSSIDAILADLRKIEAD